MFQLQPLQKIIHYLNLYKHGFLHGEFLILFIQETVRKIKNFPPAYKKALENFLAKTELYESDPGIRENEKWLIGDKELIKEVRILEGILSQKRIKNFRIDTVPRPFSEEKDKKKIFFSYIDLYKKNELAEEDFLLFTWFFLFKYLNIKNFNNYPFLIRWQLRNFAKLRKRKSFIHLTAEEKETIKKIILSLKK